MNSRSLSHYDTYGKVVPFQRVPRRRADELLAELTAATTALLELDRRRRRLFEEYESALAREARR
jgi:hypothetical protein